MLSMLTASHSSLTLTAIESLGQLQFPFEGFINCQAQLPGSGVVKHFHLNKQLLFDHLLPHE